jgi:hypothetical protein
MEVIDVQQIDNIGFNFEITFGDCDGKDVMTVSVNRHDIEEIASVLFKKKKRKKNGR